ncbi:hypothetical protein [Campylobacter hyointestinalis]|uniref:hypothetical protein n=1 Tax=Campylobacter hyointestinalis TaxID=198 RepID=UPI000DCB1A30|nr:hypothetical protein [Campylobacter hyointestinalis]RAZ60043.1 hypothetical protein CHL10071_08010 [Campylobacter hyointestinalis subsp. lawsonii]
MNLLINTIKNLPHSLDENFQNIYEYMNDGYNIYSQNIKDELNKINIHPETIYNILDISNTRHFSFIILLMKLYNRYMFDTSFYYFYDRLIQDNVDLGYTIKAMYLMRTNLNLDKIKSNINYIISNLQNGYESNEDKDIINFIVKQYIFNSLNLNRKNLSIYNSILVIFEQYFLDIKNDFLDIKSLQDFLSQARDKDEFLNKWAILIHNIFYYDNIENTPIEIENSDYADFINSIKNIEFKNILNYAKEYYSTYITDINSRWNNLDRGEAVLKEKEDLIQYIHSFGKMHSSKLQESLKLLLDGFNKLNKLNVIDYGCGQAMGIMNLCDFINDNKLDCKIDEIILIEPSKLALSRAILHSNAFCVDSKINPICKYLNDIEESELKFINKEIPVIHIFSNILDMEAVVLNQKLYNSIENAMGKSNLFICVSPYISEAANNRIDIFYEYFRNKYNARLIANEKDKKPEHKYTKYSILFEVNK